jgi:hypothetical protein
MKRSEIIKQMLQLYKEMEPHYPQYFTKDHADEMLCIIEMKGMLPPQPAFTKYPFIYGWDPEDVIMQQNQQIP